MKANDPIVTTNVWTKEKILDQLDEYGPTFTADDISDEDAQRWADKEADLMFEAISNGEDFYVRNVSKLNEWLYNSTMERNA